MKYFITLVSIFLIYTNINASLSDNNLPKRMVWSSYELGASGYSEASAVAEGMMRKYDIRVRLHPSGTSIGRLLALKRNRVSIGFLGSEAYFSSEGIYDFSSKKWGPQDIRIILGRPNTFGIAVAGDSDIKTIADLKGRKVAYVTGNPSLNVKLEAMLAFANLSWEDVNPKIYPGFTPTIKALQNGKLDAAGAVPSGSAVYELAASKKGIRWLSLPQNNIEGWKKLNQIIPFMNPQIETMGAGLDNDNPAYIGGYHYPNVTVYASTSEDEVYNFIKALDQSFDLYKDINSVMYKWQLDIAAGTPAEAPIHKGAIKYLKEKKLWSIENEEWNNARLKRLNLLIKAWADFIKSNDNLDEETFKKAWLKERDLVLAKN